MIPPTSLNSKSKITAMLLLIVGVEPMSTESKSRLLTTELQGRALTSWLCSSSISYLASCMTRLYIHHYEGDLRWIWLWTTSDTNPCLILPVNVTTLILLLLFANIQHWSFDRAKLRSLRDRHCKQKRNKKYSPQKLHVKLWLQLQTLNIFFWKTLLVQPDFRVKGSIIQIYSWNSAHFYNTMLQNAFNCISSTSCLAPWGQVKIPALLEATHRFLMLEQGRIILSWLIWGEILKLSKHFIRFWALLGQQKLYIRSTHLPTSHKFHKMNPLPHRQARVFTLFCCKT